MTTKIYIISEDMTITSHVSNVKNEYYNLKSVFIITVVMDKSLFIYR